MPTDVICFSHLRWGFVYQRPNHLMSRFARDGRVLFVEEPIFDAQTAHLETRVVEPGLTVVVAHLPPDTRPDAARHASACQRAMIDGLLTRERMSNPVLWFYTPMALPLAGSVAGSVTVYDCMDELSGFLGAPPELRAREDELFRQADLVFTGGHSLYEAKRGAHPSVHAFPSSVDAAHFALAREGSIDDPPDQAAIPHPRAGFFGVIDERMDLELVATLADALPEVHLVFVGPVVKIDPASLPTRPNVHFLGMKTYQELPAYLAGWDVALMPFARNDATRFISPTKTLEYLAAGRPVVSTPIHDVVHPYGELSVVRVAEGSAFVAAVRDALAERGTAVEGARRGVADMLVARTSWDLTYAQMKRLIQNVSTKHRDARDMREPEPDLELELELVS